jgi:hypothetical protein
MPKSNQYLLFKNKDKIELSFEAAEIGKLTKIFIPSEWRDLYWASDAYFVYGMILNKKTNSYGPSKKYTAFRLTILIGAEIYDFFWLRKGRQIRMVDISKVMQPRHYSPCT